VVGFGIALDLVSHGYGLVKSLSVASAVVLVIVQHTRYMRQAMGGLGRGERRRWEHAATFAVALAAWAVMSGSNGFLPAWALLPALVVALIVTLSRNAWVGACAGVGLLLLFRDFRLLGFLPVLAALFIAVAPATVTERVTSIFKIADPQQATASVLSNQDRVAMIRSGWRMIQDHPLTGVGPDMIEQVYPGYRDATAVNQLNPHLHNVPVQIAAERGLPALAIWIVMLVVLVRDFVRQRRTAVWVFLPNAGLACVAAMVAAGMFEHNFGDSEFLMLFLLIVTLPYAAAGRDLSPPTNNEPRTTNHEPRATNHEPRLADD